MRLQTSSSVFNQYRDKSPTSLPFMFSRGKVLTFLLRPQSVAFGPSVCLVFIPVFSHSLAPNLLLWNRGENKVPRGMREWEKDWKREEDISGIRREKDSRARAKPPRAGKWEWFLYFPAYFSTLSPRRKKKSEGETGKAASATNWEFVSPFVRCSMYTSERQSELRKSKFNLILKERGEGKGSSKKEKEEKVQLGKFRMQILWVWWDGFKGLDQKSEVAKTGDFRFLSSLSSQFQERECCYSWMPFWFLRGTEIAHR